MKIVFVDVRNRSTVPELKLTPGDVLMGLTIGDDGVVTKEGVPQHKLYPSIGVMTLGLQRFPKQDARNSMTSVASQAYNFRLQFPTWDIATMYRPIYDINPDETLAAALLDPDIGPVVMEAGTKLHAILAELSHWAANRFVYVQQFKPSLLNNVLNEFPFPFKDIAGRSRLQSIQDYFYDQQAWWAENLGRLDPAQRVFPNLKFEILHRNEKSALILVESDKYGSDDLIAQQFYQANPSCVRIILARRIPGTNKHAVSVVNTLLLNPTMAPYNYPDIKAINALEKQKGGEPNWKNLKITATAPKKGSVLEFESIWSLTKINE